MKSLRLIFCVYLFLISMGCSIFNRSEVTKVDKDLKELKEELKLIRSELEKQGKQIQLFYDSFTVDIGPEEIEKNIAQKKEKREEEKRLAVKIYMSLEDAKIKGILSFLPKSGLLVVPFKDGTINFYNLESKKIVKVISGPTYRVDCIAISSNEERLVAGTLKGEYYVWDINTGQVIFNRTNEWPVHSITISNDGALLAWATNGKYNEEEKWTEPDESLEVIEILSGKKLMRCEVGRGDYQAMSFTPDGNAIAVIMNNRVGLWECKTGKLIREFGLQTYGPLSVCCSPDGKTLAVGYGPEDIGIWDIETGNLIHLLKGHGNWVVTLCFTPDSKFLVSGAGDSTARIWDLTTGKEVGRHNFKEHKGDYVDSVSISPDAKLFAAGCNNSFVVCRMPSF